MSCHTNPRAAVLARAARIESLERRMFLSLSPAGGEFRANTFTTSAQYGAAAAMDADGDFILAWQSYGQDGSNVGIYAQRYNVSGVAQGAEFRVNSTTAGPQAFPAIAADPDGDFVVVWNGDPATGTPLANIYAQRYNAAGVPQGGEILVNSFPDNVQDSAAVATDAAGNFVVVWRSVNQDGSGSGIYGQRFNFDGIAQGPEFRVNQTTANDQSNPSVAMDLAGNFVVTWHAPDGAFTGIFAHRYNSAGVGQGGEFQVNTTTANQQLDAAVAMDATGDFVIVWRSFGQEGAGDFGGIYGQRYNAAGVAQGGEFHVNTYTTDTQNRPTIAMDADGDFVVTWGSAPPDGSSYGVYAQAFAASGAPQGVEFRVNTYTTSAQTEVNIARSHTGSTIIAWRSSGQDGSDYGIYAQRYLESASDTTAPLVGGVFANGRQVAPYSLHDPAISQIVVSFSEDMSVAGGAVGANSVTNSANWSILRDGIELNPAAISISYGFAPATGRHQATVTLPAAYSSGHFSVRVKDTLRDLADNALDGDASGAPLGQFAIPFSVTTLFSSRGGEFRANTFTSSQQKRPAVAMDADGDFVIVWDTRYQDGIASYGVYAQRYSANGTPQGAEFRVNTYTINNQASPAVAMDDAGNFVVVWTSFQPTDPDGGIFAQKYGFNGIPQGEEFRVNTTTAGQQFHPAVAMDVERDFVVTWASGTTTDSDVFAQRFNILGAPQGAEFRVNTYTTSVQEQPSVAMDRNGNFAVAWESNGQDGSGDGIYAQRYTAAGGPLGAEFRANTTTANGQTEPSIGMNVSGEFIIAWRSDFQDASTTGVYAQRYFSTGAVRGGEFQINAVTAGSQVLPSVAVREDGGFVVAFQTPDGSGNGIAARRFDASGSALGSEFPVNTFTANSQNFPAVAIDPAGDFVVTWQSDVQDGANYGIYAQRYGVARTPRVGALIVSPDPVVAGTPLLLVASGVTDDGSIAFVSFYRESNATPGLQTGAGGDLLLGTANTQAGGAWSINVPTIGLAPGQYTYFAQATDDAGLVGAPRTDVNAISFPAPTVSNAAFLFDMLPQRVTFTFDQNVSASLSLADFTVQQLPGGPFVPPDALSYDAGTNTATLSFSTPLSDGNYRAIAIASGITNAGGTPMAGNVVHNFSFLRGDTDGDGDVDLDDFNILASNFNTAGKTFSQGNFDYDPAGNVNLDDFNLLAARFGTALGAYSRGGGGAFATTRIQQDRWLDDLLS